jgi:UDP:flavonoid glycosyltransferase YjiC (YdhE family)
MRKPGILKSFLKQVLFEIEQIAFFRPTVVVSDSRFSTILAGKLTGRRIVTVLNEFFLIIPGFRYYRILNMISKMFSLGFVSPIWGMSDVIIVPDFPPPYTISTFHMRVPKLYRQKIKLVGPILPVRPEDLPDKHEIRKHLGFDDRPIIYAVASGPENERRWLSRKLEKFLTTFPSKYQIVLSLGRRDLSSEPKKKGNVTVYGWLNRRYEMLKACDLLISRGGHVTVTQALAYGKPMILIPTQEQTEQVGNAKAAEKLGIAKVIDQRMLSTDKLLSMVDEIFGSDFYFKNSEKFMSLSSKLNALETISKIIINYGEGED